MAKDDEKDDVEKTDLTPQEMVDIIGRGESVMVKGKIISSVAELPAEARKLAAKRIAGDSADVEETPEEKVLKGTVADVTAYVAKVNDLDELKRLFDAEAARVPPRVGVRDAILARRAELEKK